MYHRKKKNGQQSTTRDSCTEKARIFPTHPKLISATISTAQAGDALIPRQANLHMKRRGSKGLWSSRFSGFSKRRWGQKVVNFLHVRLISRWSIIYSYIYICVYIYYILLCIFQYIHKISQKSLHAFPFKRSDLQNADGFLQTCLTCLSSSLCERNGIDGGAESVAFEGFLEPFLLAGVSKESLTKKNGNLEPIEFRIFRWKYTQMFEHLTMKCPYLPQVPFWRSHPQIN